MPFQFKSSLSLKKKKEKQHMRFNYLRLLQSVCLSFTLLQYIH